MLRPPPRSTLFPTRRSSDLLPLLEALARLHVHALEVPLVRRRHRPLLRRHELERRAQDRKSTRLNSSHPSISYAVFCLKKKTHIVSITTVVPYEFAIVPIAT